MDKEKKQNEGKQKRENMVEGVDSSRFFELATNNKKYVIGLNLHEIKNEILLDCTGDFELNGLMDIGPVKHRTNIKFRNLDDFGKLYKRNRWRL